MSPGLTHTPSRQSCSIVKAANVSPSFSPLQNSRQQSSLRYIFLPFLPPFLCRLVSHATTCLCLPSVNSQQSLPTTALTFTFTCNPSLPSVLSLFPANAHDILLCKSFSCHLGPLWRCLFLALSLYCYAAWDGKERIILACELYPAACLKPLSLWQPVTQLLLSPSFGSHLTQSPVPQIPQKQSFSQSVNPH